MKTAVEIDSELLKFRSKEISVHTVRRRLRKSGLNSRDASRVPLISLKNRNSHLSFAKKFSNRTPKNWEKMFFSDESKVNLINSDGRSYVRRRVNESFSKKCVTLTVKYGGGKVMYWGGFTGAGVGPLIEIENTLKHDGHINLLRDQSLPFSNKNLASG